MFGFGHVWELVIVLLIAVLFFGPKRLPEIGGAVGKSIREFKKGATELEDKVTGTDESGTHIPHSTPRDEAS